MSPYAAKAVRTSVTAAKNNRRSRKPTTAGHLAADACLSKHPPRTGRSESHTGETARRRGPRDRLASQEDTPAASNPRAVGMSGTGTASTGRSSVYDQAAYWLTVAAVYFLVGVLFLYSGKSKLFDLNGH